MVSVSDTLAVVPYACDKVGFCYYWAREKVQLRRRFREYEQLQNWTKSSLQISTGFDWGHTCDLAEAISNAATEKLGSTFAFTSRILLSKSLGQPIEPDLWVQVIKRIVLYSDHYATNPVFKRSLQTVVGEMPELSAFEHQIIEHWILSGPLRRDYALHGQAFHRPRSASGSVYYPALGPESMLPKNAFRLPVPELYEHVRVARRVATLLQHAYNMHSSDVVINRCCQSSLGSRRNHAIKVTNCNGPAVLPGPPYIDNQLDEDKWRSLRVLWSTFIKNWDKIVSMASLSLPLPETPGINNLLLHDMATGYVASSKMLRCGAKFTDRKGKTTIVHHVERAAVVPSGCRIVRMEDSAIEVHGLRRSWGAAAEEFARYALIRCDLVNRSRMNFVAAHEDWRHHYTRWDRAPSSLSEWAKDDTPDSKADDYRLVLLRQAIGKKRSIGVRSRKDTKASAFGGFVEEESANSGAESTDAGNGRQVSNQIRDKVIVIDQPLTLTVRTYGEAGNVAGCTIGDKWGFKDGFLLPLKDMYYQSKQVQESGMPDIYEITRVSETRLVKGVRKTLSSGEEDGEKEAREVVLSFA